MKKSITITKMIKVSVIVFTLLLSSCATQKRSSPEDIIRYFLMSQKAADQGVASAQNDVGVIYENGRGVFIDLKQAVLWYQKAANQGYAPAQSNLGFMYENGRGVLKDDKKAVLWYQKAADQNYAPAQYNLGIMFDNGQGVPKNKKQAVLWYQKAANQNYARAQSNLGNMYVYGGGTAKDLKKAVHWIGKAAKQGNSLAQNNLSWLLATSPDPDIRNGKEAIKWAKKALSGKNSDNISNLDTLAVAYAEVKDFESAIRTLHQIKQILNIMDTSDSHKKSWIKMISERMELFKLNKPFRDYN